VFGRAPGLRFYKILKRLLCIVLSMMPPCFLTDCGEVIRAVRRDDLGQMYKPGTFTLRSAGAKTCDFSSSSFALVREV
jgi:hypothetical protein